VLWTLPLLAHAGTATLHVGVHREAGVLRQIAAEGETGQCVLGPSRISCPAEGPVRFFWHGDRGAVLVGEVEVLPGEVGRAWVLADPGQRQAELDLLGGDVAFQDVLAIFSPAPGSAVGLPSLEMVRRLETLTAHPDPLVRRAAIEGLVPFIRHTASDPFEAGAPELLQPGWILRLSRDPDVRVRRRLASRIKELVSPEVDQAEEARQALATLITDSKPPVQRAAMVTSRALTQQGLLAGEETWERALNRVSQPGGPGRAAVGTLAFLAKDLELSDVVNPTEAVSRAIRHHPEPAWGLWGAWCHEVDIRQDWAEQLLTQTSGLDRRLLRHWSTETPEVLAQAIRNWEPTAPHSERFKVVQAWLSDATSDELRRALQLPPVEREPAMSAEEKTDLD